MEYRLITEATEKTVHRFLSGDYERDKSTRGRYVHVRDKNGQPASDGVIIDTNEITDKELKDYKERFLHVPGLTFYVHNPQTCITGSFKDKGLELTLYEEMRKINTRLNANAWPTHLFRLEDTK